MQRRMVLSLVGLLAIVAACGSSAVSAGAATATATASPEASAGSSATPTPGPTASPTASRGPFAADWPTYHRDASRSGYNPDFAPLRAPLVKAWTSELDGAVYAQPLVVNGRVLVATENDSVYSLDSATGAVIWSKKLGTPVPLKTLPCGNIDPLGITGTPAFDAKTGSLFLVAEVTGPKHVMFALDAETGEIRWSRDVDLPGDDPRPHQQRTAVVVGNGYAYFGYGGLAGDCGEYTGKVIGVPTSGQGDTIAYRVPVAREGGIWATAGPVMDDAGNLFVSTGNGSSTTKFDGSDSVLKLAPDLKRLSFFAPSVWADDNARDLDLGSLSPTLLPGGYVFIVGKRGVGYTLRQANLGGIGGQVYAGELGCGGFGGTARSGYMVYVGCQAGLRAVEVKTNGKFREAWRTTTAGGPPTVGGGAVWVLSSAGLLVALDPLNAKTLASISVGEISHFASPTLWNGLVLVGTLKGVVAVKGS